MKYFVWCLVLILPISGFSQNRKAQKAKLKKEAHSKVLKLIDRKSFVVRANMLRDQSGRMVPLGARTNFVAVVDSTGYIQVALGSFAPNSSAYMGTTTVESRVTRFLVKDRGPGKGIDVRMTFFGQGTYDIFLYLSDNGFADLSISGLRGQSLQFSGDIVPVVGSRTLLDPSRF